MSIQTTKSVTREMAITRIKKIADMITRKQWKELEGVTSEDSSETYILKTAMNERVNNRLFLNGGDLTQWTNRMLEGCMDLPYFRYTMFDNYEVVD